MNRDATVDQRSMNGFERAHKVPNYQESVRSTTWESCPAPWQNTCSAKYASYDRHFLSSNRTVMPLLFFCYNRNKLVFENWNCNRVTFLALVPVIVTVKFFCDMLMAGLDCAAQN